LTLTIRWDSLSRKTILTDHRMSTLEAALRGGAVVLLLLRIPALARNARSDHVSRWSALFLLGIAAYVVDSAPGVRSLAIGWRIAIHLVSCATPAAFWITTGAYFVDEFRARWYHALAGLALVALGAAEIFIRSLFIAVTHSTLSLLCVLFGIWHALAGRSSDLVEGRRRLRVVFAVATALYTVLIVATDWLWPGGLSAASLTLANAAGLLSLIFLFAVLGSLPPIGPPLAPAAVRARPSPDDDPPTPPSPTGPEAALLEALRKLMDVGRVYREQDLGIASLSQKLGVPEYRLRRLINGQLGHRNFSAFINGYRLAEAEAALSDPDQADVPILTIALDAGFGSIGPFNRAFKAHTGRTPTEYRRARAAEPLPIPKTTGHP
jgi:AraC-like DNA-binding protein